MRSRLTRSFESLEPRIMFAGVASDFRPLSTGNEPFAIDDALAVNVVAIAGDANRDGNFDQQDILDVLRAGKYLTGERALWSEGDWNTDGVFDPKDLVLALQRGGFGQPTFNVRGVSRAHGAGTYFVDVGIRTELQFNSVAVQCKVAHSVLPDGTVFQMFMRSTSVDSTVIDSQSGSVVMTGSMISTVNLTFTDGSTAQLTETVPYSATGTDNGDPGAGVDTFSLTVDYADTPALDQRDLFGSPATFAGTLRTGNIVVR